MPQDGTKIIREGNGGKITADEAFPGVYFVYDRNGELRLTTFSKSRSEEMYLSFPQPVRPAPATDAPGTASMTPAQRRGII